MKYYIDCEFDNQGRASPLLSIALVREDGHALYAITDYALAGVIHDPWVSANVMPLLYEVPLHTDNLICAFGITPYMVSGYLQEFFDHDPDIEIVADWPVDIKYLCELLITGPGTMIDIPGIRFTVVRVDAYPSELPGAKQHNAYWDARALRYLLTRDLYQPCLFTEVDHNGL